MRLVSGKSWSPVGAVTGLAIALLPAAVAHNFPKLAYLEKLGAVVLGGLAAMVACQPRRNVRRDRITVRMKGGMKHE
jgi:hypothetical protein